MYYRPIITFMEKKAYHQTEIICQKISVLKNKRQ